MEPGDVSQLEPFLQEFASKRGLSFNSHFVTEDFVAVR